MNEEHHITIGIVAKSHGGTETRLRQLYVEASKALESTTQAVSTSTTTVSLMRHVGTDAAVAVATDIKTGWFVQLVSQKDTPLLLTVGRKLCVSGYDPVNKQTATQMY